MPGSQAVAIGDRVAVGQLILDSASTGDATGPHLHFAIQAGGARRCPQVWLVSIAKASAPVAPGDLPTTGCVD
jgi:murein DD-endopeptidase MepM/ murein hydrolase activator NlpD